MTYYFFPQCRTQSIFGDTVYSCYCKLRLVTPTPWLGLRGQKLLILITLDCWKRHFLEKNYIENSFYLLKVLKVLKLLFENVEEILFGWIFLGAHNAQMLSKHVWVHWSPHSSKHNNHFKVACRIKTNTT